MLVRYGDREIHPDLSAWSLVHHLEWAKRWLLEASLGDGEEGVGVDDLSRSARASLPRRNCSGEPGRLVCPLRAGAQGRTLAEGPVYSGRVVARLSQGDALGRFAPIGQRRLKPAARPASLREALGGSLLEISGTASVKAPPDAVGRVLSDPARLRRSLPGCSALEPDADGYRIEISIGVAAVRGTYQGAIRILQHEPGQRFDFKLELEAPRGYVEATVHAFFTPSQEGTDVAYKAESELGGPLAALGQRVAGGIATLLVRQFCDGIGREAQGFAQG